MVFSCEAGEKLPGVEVITPYLYVKIHLRPGHGSRFPASSFPANGLRGGKRAWWRAPRLRRCTLIVLLIKSTLSPRRGPLEQGEK